MHCPLRNFGQPKTGDPLSSPEQSHKSKKHLPGMSVFGTRNRYMTEHRIKVPKADVTHPSQPTAAYNEKVYYCRSVSTTYCVLQ